MVDAGIRPPRPIAVDRGGDCCWSLVLRAEFVPRWMAVAMIVAASLLPLFQQESPANFIPVLLGLVCVILGTHLLVRGGQSAVPVL